MVAAKEDSSRPREPSHNDIPTAAATRRRSLHNFSFPSSWGTQRILRCVNISAQNVKSAPKVEEEAESSSLSKPLNLRTMRANPSLNPNQKPELGEDFVGIAMSVEDFQGREGGFNYLGKMEGGNVMKRERCEFSVALRKEEIEDDFLKMKGLKPPRRPKKRAKYIQRQLDSVFPGLGLSEMGSNHLGQMPPVPVRQPIGATDFHIFCNYHLPLFSVVEDLDEKCTEMDGFDWLGPSGQQKLGPGDPLPSEITPELYKIEIEKT